MKKFSIDVAFTTAIAILIIIFGSVMMAPLLTPYNFTEIVGRPWQSAGGGHPLGLDHLGRDLWTRMLYGGRVSIFVAALVATLSFMIGVPVGIMAGLRKGVFDQIISRLFEVFLAMPTLIFVLMVLSVFGTSIPVLVLTLGFIDSTRVFRLARFLAFEIAERDFVRLARLRGESRLWIIYHEILPHALTPLLVELGLRFSFSFLLISALSFLGLGVQPPVPDWGNMVHDNATVIALGVPAALYPAMAIALLSACVNIVIDRVRKLTGGRH